LTDRGGKEYWDGESIRVLGSRRGILRGLPTAGWFKGKWEGVKR